MVAHLSDGLSFTFRANLEFHSHETVSNHFHVHASFLLLDHLADFTDEVIIGEGVSKLVDESAA
jgi:hypothetical protein